MKLDSPPQKATLKLLAADQTKKLVLVRKVYTENANKVHFLVSLSFICSANSSRKEFGAENNSEVINKFRNYEI